MSLPSTLVPATLRRWWAGRHADDGVSLVEVIVAIGVLMVILTGTTSALIASQAATRDSMDRSVGTNVALQVIGELQAQPFGSLPLGTTTQTVVVDGTTYDVVRELTLVPVSADSDSCNAPTSGPGSAPAYVDANITVSWPRMQGGPATTGSIITPGVGDLDPTKGQVAVTVLDRDSGPGAFHSVRYQAQTPAVGSGNQVTDSNGCAFFINVDPGNYDVEVDRTGYVDLAGDQLSTTSISVTASTTTPVEFIYDEAATIRVTGVPATAPPITVPPTTPVFPSTVAFTVESTYLGVENREALPGNGQPRDLSDLFPFLSGYRLYAGQCPAASPDANGAAANQIVAVDPGQATDIDLPMHVVRVSGTPGAAIQASMDDTANSCAETLDFGTVPTGGERYILLPYGVWSVTVGGALTTVTLNEAVLSTVVSVP